MPDFSQRSQQKELLDNDAIPFTDIKRNMEELEIINKYLGGHRITLNGLRYFSDLWSVTRPADPLLICEIGCGGGDNLKAIDTFLKKNEIPVRFIGIDINKECIRYAKKNCSELKAEWICSDYRNVNFTESPHIIFSSLFCHHFTFHELKGQLAWMHRNSTAGFFINDLHRHPLAYHSIRLLTGLFSRSYLVKNDAPLSVRRGFKRKELISLMQQFGTGCTHIKWQWAFRWLMVVKKQV